ncbi:hypothetical protein Ddye_014427 [Dipteronia dyeriana]|uniref:Protein FAR1-RELATED SEQUENCE n=1 Tax=Dipteronia dyeriana TaxID=168575 RepID=A0AAD9X7U7_9ROSI|nr:hypothetical protein Ddye_014427 [Dipteronia dyeriana]
MHNHPFVRQECTHMLPSHRKISVTQAIEVDLAEESRISLKSSYELLDSEEQITNMFWEDAKMIIDYGQFGDVLSFDTTYKINKENRTLAVFFLIHFERAVNDKRFKELKAEYDLLSKLVNVKINAKMLIQAREVFIKAISLEFQREFEQAVELNMNCATIGGNIIYSVNTDCASKERHVKMDSDNTLSCSFKMSQMKGVLCSHVIKILRDAFNIKEIPTQYILKRWTKQARVECVQDIHGREIQEDPKLQQTCRYRSLCSIFTRISSRFSKSEKAYILANEQALLISKQLYQVYAGDSPHLCHGVLSNSAFRFTPVHGINGVMRIMIPCLRCVCCEPGPPGHCCKCIC